MVLDGISYRLDNCGQCGGHERDRAVKERRERDLN